MARPAFTLPPSADDIADLAERVLAKLPGKYARALRGVGIIVDDLPEAPLLAELGLANAWELTAIHRAETAMLHLFRDPILLEWIETNEDLTRLVRRAVIHELAHHLGLGASEIASLTA
jgi:predicted Zn-dependent protease with MMP-like domain